MGPSGPCIAFYSRGRKVLLSPTKWGFIVLACSRIEGMLGPRSGPNIAPTLVEARYIKPHVSGA